MGTTELKIKLGKRVVFMNLTLDAYGWKLQIKEISGILMDGWFDKKEPKHRVEHFGVNYSNQSVDMFYDELKDMIKKALPKI